MKFSNYFIILGLVVVSAQAADKPPIPDFTVSQQLPEKAAHDWNLGPTGARGWVYAWRGESTDSRQILITAVEPDSPAAGKLTKDDVILGIGGTEFGSDARISFAKAITSAEAANGALSLIRFRDGARKTVKIQLEPLGEYSPTAPFNCEKSTRIFERGCAALAERMRKNPDKRGNPIQRSLNALALLASGDKTYAALIKEEADWAKTYEIDDGLHSWPTGWVNLFLAEYLLATGDESARPNLEKLSKAIAGGQSHVGTWGHRFAYEHNGILRGYGAMNQVGLSLTTSMILAREAGVSDPDVYAAIEKSQKFLAFYIGKGAIPYGDHHPWLKMHDDNGKASAAAVLFDLISEAQGAEFFSRMGVSSFGTERESGHTGNYFNMLWALPGVSRSGPEATGAWIRESAWMLDLARKQDYSFDFLGKPAAMGGEHSYRGWDCTGPYLLGYAVALKKTRFTGAKPSSAPELTSEQAAELIEAGRGWTPASDASLVYDARSIEDLIDDLTSWSPVIRERAALALAKKEGDFVPQLIEMLGSDDLNIQFGACAAFEQLGPRGASGVPALTALLSHDELWLRAQAAEALAGIGEPARVAIPELLKLVAQPPNEQDPRGHIQRFLAFALFDSGRGLLGKNIENIDRDLLRQATEAVLRNEDGRARGSMRTIYQQLSPDEIEPLLPSVLEAVVEQSPSGVMFSDGIRMAGLEVLAKNRIAEGLPLCLELAEPERWGSDRRLDQGLRALKIYGAAANSELPKLRAMAEEAAHPKSKSHKRHQQLLDTIAFIEKSDAGQPLRNLN
ncbi:MAG: hypothetical protein ACI8UO_002377 [Verrucomicrobiales bacterium]|jgi:hypothetical protein